MSSPPENKRKMKKPLSILSLPDDLLLNCLARVSRLYYPILSLVSKSFRSLLASPELYKVRSLLGKTENYLYVCLCYGRKYLWFTLCRKPNKSSGYVLASVPIPPSHYVCFSGLVSDGSNIYSVSHSSSFSILDCKSHKWLEAPSLRHKPQLMSFSAKIINQKIYVPGNYEDGDSKSLKSMIEVFDIKTQTWDPEPISCSITKDYFRWITFCIDGKLYIVPRNDRGVLVYDPKEGRWDLVGPEMSCGLSADSYCVIDNVLYSALYGTITWFDTEVSQWRELKGLFGLPKFCSHDRFRLADYGGKMMVSWIEDISSDGRTLWCAEIAIERRKSCEIWGKVEWFEQVVTAVPSSCNLVKALTTIL